MGLVTLSLSCHIVIYYVSVTLSWYRAQLVEADEAFTSLGLYCNYLLVTLSHNSSQLIDAVQAFSSLGLLISHL